MASQGIAMVTGASRGIGKATALALAEAGYDLVLAARTVSATRRASENVRGADGEVLPGTLEQTEEEVRAHGSDAISVPLDLLDLPSIDAALAEAKNYFGQIDVIVNNAIYQGPGLMADFLDGPFENLEKTFKANVLAQVYIVRSLLPDMLARKSGTVVNLTSAAGMTSPPIKLAQGGWSFAHGATKAAFHRMAGILALEYGDQGILAYNLEPGLVASESMVAVLGETSELEKMGVVPAPVSVPAAVIRWLCTSPEAVELSGRNVFAQEFCKEHRLVPGWPKQ
ncbi:MAG: SDR family NAD(P)-dependent oxidoreductase [Halieaceae bacterium]|nr:SDR family NAD(P)-dependent oxidoreductase [Halieaceae bacterium]